MKRSQSSWAKTAIYIDELLKVVKAADFPLIEKPNIIVSNEVGCLF